MKEIGIEQDVVAEAGSMVGSVDEFGAADVVFEDEIVDTEGLVLLE